MIRKGVIRKSGFDASAKTLNSLAPAPASPGQRCPQRYPYPEASTPSLGEALGDPLSIRDVAGVIGCSPWTVRQRYLPAGLPHHRLTPNGKLIFYRNQVIRWLIDRQQKGMSS